MEGLHTYALSAAKRKKEKKKRKEREGRMTGASPDVST